MGKEKHFKYKIKIMTPENFTYWLQGFFEISDAKKLDETQVQIIKDHLDLVFNKVTPDRSESTLKEFKWPTKEENSNPSILDLKPRVYCATSSTLDSSLFSKTLC
jgi:hypothetical protein